MSAVRPSALITGYLSRRKPVTANSRTPSKWRKKPLHLPTITAFTHSIAAAPSSTPPKKYIRSDCRPDRIHNAKNSQDAETDTESQKPSPVLGKFAGNLDQ
jgi:hypothetical protein